MNNLLQPRIWPSSLASSDVGPCDVPFRYASETNTAVPRDELSGGTLIFVVSRQQFMKYPGYGHKTIFSIMGKMPMELLQKFHPAFLACTATGREIGFVHIAYIFSRVINFVNFRTYCDGVMSSSLID
jgi:hypothetical protein